MGILTIYSKNTVTVFHTDTAVMHRVKSDSLFLCFSYLKTLSVEGLSSDILLSCGSHGVLEMWKLGE